MKSLDLGHQKVLQRHTRSLDMDTGEVVETDSQVLLKTEKRERFMLLYVENFNLVVELRQKTQRVLAKLLANKVTYGSNEVVLSAGVRTQIAEELETSKQVIANAISELVSKKVLKRKKLNGGGCLYYLNPYLFGQGEWNTIQKQRQQFTIDFDFVNYQAQKEIKTITSHDGLPDKDNIQVLKREQYTDEYGVGHFNAIIAPKDEIQTNKENDDEVISVEAESVDSQNIEKAQTQQTESASIELEILREQNRAKELSIKEKELSIKELELKAKIDDSAPKLFD
ncbi:hypothetical protein [Helicobacter sp. T3_23-1059]